ncbi:MAG: hypothetical protein Q9173_000242 [Seirophora scorigena]
MEEYAQILYQTKSLVKVAKKLLKDIEKRKDDENIRRNEPRPALYPEDEVVWLPRFHTEQLEAAYTADREAVTGKYAALIDTLKGDSVIVHHTRALASRKVNPEWAGTGSRKKGPLPPSQAEALEMRAKKLERKVKLARKGKFWKT